MIVLNIFPTIEHLNWCIKNISENYWHFEIYQKMVQENSENYSNWIWMYDVNHMYFRFNEDSVLFKLVWA